MTRMSSRRLATSVVSRSKVHSDELEGHILFGHGSDIASILTFRTNRCAHVTSVVTAAAVRRNLSLLPTD